MNVIVMGCGRVGASVAGQLSEGGHDVSVIDTDPFAFSRLPTNFAGRRITGSGNDFRILEAITLKKLMYLSPSHPEIIVIFLLRNERSISLELRM